jgi:formylglycine-generating enzyme required for sulfatase activity
MVRLLILLFAFSFSLIAKEPLRTWTSIDGRFMNARFVQIIGDEVRLEDENGKRFNLKIKIFSDQDQKYFADAYKKSLFADPIPFNGNGRGAVIVNYVKGDVTLIEKKRSSYSKFSPQIRKVIMGEPIGYGSSINTGRNSEIILIFTNGSVAHIGQNSKVQFSELWQKKWNGSDQGISTLSEETSPSRSFLKLDRGELVVDIKKLNKGSSFLVKTPILQAGIRGTQFKLSATSNASKLMVLEGQVDFLESDQKVRSVKENQMTTALKGKMPKNSIIPKTEMMKMQRILNEAIENTSAISLNQLARTTSEFSKKTEIIIKSAANLEMIWCPPGGFAMGPSAIDAQPSHEVVLNKGFYLGRYEVTNRQYREVTGKVRGDNFPVYVSWKDAVSFCEKLNTIEKLPFGWTFALPSEVQWEYACRAGTTSLYSWGGKFNTKLANTKESGLVKSTEVGSFPPNLWGFYDMHGNMSEWCFDKYGSYPGGKVVYYEKDHRLRRGGSWNSTPYNTSSSERGLPQLANRKATGVDGFRLALIQAK